MAESQDVQGAGLGDAAARINDLLGDDGNINPSGEPSRALEDRARDARGRFTASDADDDSTAGMTDEDFEAEGAGDADDRAISDDDQGAPTDGDDADDEGPIESILELAEAIDVEPDELMRLNLSVPTADGGELAVALADLVTGHKDASDIQGSRARLADERRAFEDESRQRLEAMTNEAQIVASQYNFLEQQIVAEFQDPNTQRLRDEDPTQYMLRENEARQKLGQLQQARAQAAQQYDQFRTQYMTEMVERETKLLKEVYPEWGPDYQSRVKETMVSLGLNPDVEKVFDSRYIRGLMELHDLRKEVAELRQLKAKGKQAAQRVKKDVPKLTKPGRQKGERGLQKRNLRNLKKRFNETHHERDAAKLIEQMGILDQ